MQIRKQLRVYEIFVSIFILAILAAQAAIVLGASMGVPRTGGKQFWPIISYHMYSKSRFEGDTIEVHDLLEATRRDGSVVSIGMEDLSLNLWDLRHLIKGLKTGDERSLRTFRARYANSAELTELRIMSYPLMLTRAGPAPKPSEVLTRIPLTDTTQSTRPE